MRIYLLLRYFLLIWIEKPRTRKKSRFIIIIDIIIKIGLFYERFLRNYTDIILTFHVVIILLTQVFTVISRSVLALI